MKTCLFLSLFLFMSLAIIPVSAQTRIDYGTRTYVDNDYVVYSTLHLPVYCTDDPDGEPVDVLMARHYTIRLRTHFINDVQTWQSAQLENIEFTSDWTGEVFNFKGFERVTGESDMCHLNVKGDQGNQYIVKMYIVPWSNIEILSIHSVCH